MSQLVPPYRLILKKLNSNKVIPFLGSGASLGGRPIGDVWTKGTRKFLPTAGELATHLADTAEFPPTESKDLTKVAQYYSLVGGREALKEELHNIFDSDCQPASVHKFLASVRSPLLIVTTNYDNLLERAIDEENQKSGNQVQPYDVVIHTTDAGQGDRLLWWPYGATEPRTVNANKLDIAIESRTVVYKMHGAIDRNQAKRDQFVITEDDYIDFLTRMTKNKAIPAIFAEAFQSRHFLFLGYSLNDWNLRVVLNRIEKDLRRPKGIVSWAIQHQPNDLERLFWEGRGVRIYDILIDQFVHELNARTA